MVISFGAFMEYQINQIFEGEYSPEAAIWCNENNAYIEEIDPIDGIRCFQIVAIPAPDLGTVRQIKLKELDNAFMQWYEKDATVTSSLGFVADSDSRAIMDVSGLVTVLEAQPESSRSTVAFIDHGNVAHDLTLDALKTVQLEIIQNGQSAYVQKWTYRSQIESAESVDDLNAMTFVFVGEDFSAAS